MKKEISLDKFTQCWIMQNTPQTKLFELQKEESSFKNNCKNKQICKQRKYIQSSKKTFALERKLGKSNIL